MADWSDPTTKKLMHQHRNARGEAADDAAIYRFGAKRGVFSIDDDEVEPDRSGDLRGMVRGQLHKGAGKQLAPVEARP